MADTSGSDGVQNIVSQHDSNASSGISNSELWETTEASESDISVATTSLAKPIKMDGDGDGAPSSAEASPRHMTLDGQDDQLNDKSSKGRDSAVSFDSSAESTPRKSGGKSKSAASTPPTSSGGQDLTNVDMKTSWDGSVSGGSTKGETTDGETGYKIPFKHRAGMLADPVKIAKEREKEERVRQARERLKEERQRKLEELKEQQRIAQENREKQLEMRRRKIEDLRRRDIERRAAVEERRKMKEEVERARRESILQKAEERVARYEAWKAGGRKGMFGGGAGGTPKHLSVSTSVLYQKRSPDFSSMNVLPPTRPESTMGLNTIREGRRSFIGTSSGTSSSITAMTGSFHQYQRPANTPGHPLNRASMTASMPSPVRMRDKPSRKQRPASVASSMPSFVGGEPAKSPRSKSTDRTGRDRSKNRPSRREDKAGKDKENQSEKAQKSEAEKSKDKDGDKERGEKKEKKGRVSLSFFDRLATPKYSKKDTDYTPKDTPPKKDAPIIRLSPRKAYSTTNLATMKKRASLREKPSPTHATPKQATPRDTHKGSGATSGPSTPVTPVTTVQARSGSPARKGGEKAIARTASPSRKGGEKSGSSTPRVTPPPSATSTPTHGPSVPAATSASAPASATTTPSQPPAAANTDDGTTAPRSAPSSAQDITAEEYKARLAEKRRQAREKAEKEAEEERKRQEEARLAEEERLRQEEEEQRRMEEESLRLAEEARKAEEERLQRAIEAEAKRREEEAERLEQERKAKEEAERKAREEAERLEKEKQERARKAEEERQERKKKLEMIMKRVKPDSAADTTAKVESPTKSVSSSPNLSQLNSSQNSPDEQEKPISSAQESPDSEVPVLDVPEGTAMEPISSAMTTSFIQDLEEPDSTTSTASSANSVIRSMSSGDILEGPSSHDRALERDGSERLSSSAATTPSKPEETTPTSETSSEPKPKFKSPLLQQLVENKGGDSPSGGPKFKSPLLQNLLGKTKVGARMGLSASTGDLTHNKDSTSSSPAGSVADSSMTQSAIAGSNGSSKEIYKQEGEDEDKDEDTSLLKPSEVTGTPTSFEHQHAVTNGIGRDSGDATFPTSTSKTSLDSSPPDATRLPVSMMSDSALGSSIEPHGDGDLSAPGMMSQSIIFNGHGDHKSHGMEDSSISLHSVEESVSNTASVIPFETLAENNEEERTPPTQGDGQFEELIDLLDTSGKNNSIVGGTPIIAFEENNRRPDVTESLS